MPQATPPKNTRAFFDPVNLRKTVFQTATDAFQKKLNTIETQDFKLQARNLKVDPFNHITTAHKKKAVLEKKDLTVPLKGTIDLIHKASGKVLESKHTTIAQLPYITNHNTAIYNGSEYESVNQQRLLPGIYSRIRQDGIPEAHVNPEARTGQALRILFIPEQQVFVMVIKNSQVKLYGILKDLGVPESTIKAAWGDKIYNANRATYTGSEVDKLYSLLVREK